MSSAGKPSTYVAIRDHGVRTYGQLVEVAHPTSSHGTCCACHAWNKETWQLSTRASICRECCERKASQTLGSIVKSERKARRYVLDAIKRGEDPELNLRFYSHLSGADQEWIASEIKRLRAEAT